MNYWFTFRLDKERSKFTNVYNMQIPEFRNNKTFIIQK